MKKVISLCAMTMIGLAAICQDTTSQKRNTDTIPGGNNMQADTSKWNNSNRKDSMGQGTWQNNSNSLDTSRQRQPMEGSRDSMNRGLTPNTSSDTMNGNRNNSNSGMNRNDSTNRNNNNSTGNNTTDSSKSSSATTGNNASSSSTDSSSTTTTTTTTEKVSDRIAMAEDKIYVIKDGDSTILSKEYKLSSGASVMPDGTVKYPTGKSVNLKNGQFIELPKKSESADTDNGTKAKKTTPAKKKTTTKKSTTKKTTNSSQNQ